MVQLCGFAGEANCFFDEGGYRLNWRTICRDITELKQIGGTAAAGNAVLTMR